MSKNEQPIIFTTPEFAPQGQELATKTGADFGNPDMIYDKFDGKVPNVNLGNTTTSIENRPVFWLGDFSHDTPWIPQYCTLSAIAGYGARSMDIICPYFPYGTMERIVTHGDVVTAKAMMRLLGSIPACRETKNRVAMIDIHDPREQFYGNDTCFFKMLSWMEQRAKELLEESVIVFPDLGAKKRFGKMFGERDVIVFEKIRDLSNPASENKTLTIIDGSEHIQNRDLVLVDDLVITGGTLKGAARILRDKGAGNITSLFPHAVFPRDTFDEFTHEFDRVVSSDTVPLQARKLQENPKVTIHSIVPMLADLITS